MPGFKDGNVVSMELENFQTFRKISLKFCPSFNFIAGPNGSGKSSIANAMVLAFGGTPRIIGRGKSIGEYVKFGENEARIKVVVWIEGRETKISRHISKDNQSKYFIDGKACRKMEYEELIGRLKENIGNLCQFLPQEKVSEFTRLSPEDLLVELLRAVGEEEIVEKLGRLEELETGRNKLIDMLDSCVRKKECVKRAIEVLEKDVEKASEKKRKEERIRMMYEKQDWIRYKFYTDEYASIKKDISSLKKQVEEKKEESLKIENKIMELRSSEIYSESDRLCNILGEYDENLVHLVERLRSVQQETEILKVDEESLKNKKEKRTVNAERLEKEILGLQDEISKVEVPPQPPKLDEARIGVLEEKMSNLMRIRGKIQHESSELKKLVDDLSLKKKKFHEMDEMRLQMLRRYHDDTYKAVCWLRENKHLFKDEIIEPPFVQLRIKDARYSLEVENFLGFQSLSPFICKSGKDFETFVRIMKDEKKWMINAIEAIKMNEGLHKGEESVPRETLKELGFEGVLSDFIECREEIMNYLIVAGHFDQIPVSKENVDEGLVFRKTNVKKMAAGGRYIEIKKSRYGSEHAIIYNPLKPRNLFSESLSLQELETIEEELSKKNSTRRENEEKLREILKDGEVIDKELQGLYKERSWYNSQMMEIKRKETQIRVLKGSIDRKGLELKMLLDAKGLDEEEDRIKEARRVLEVKWKKECDKLSEYLSEKEYFDVFRTAAKLFREITNIKKDIELFSESKKTLEEISEELEKKIIEKKKENFKLKKAIGEKKERLEKIEKTEEYDKALSLLPSTMDELDEEIIKEKAQLRFYNIDHKALGEFEIREQDVKDLEENISEYSKELERTEKEGTNIRSILVSRIEEMVSRIDEQFKNLFRKAGGDGKIVFVHEGLDACKWRLNIMVKFRESDDFEVLNSHRQSGGERSVSIILFLLAIQNYRPSPFRLVDEINQGMDKENEKLVHDILVALSKEGKEQFFMITPKIAPNLSYSRNMKVIVLYSSPGCGDQEDFVKYRLKVLT
ncbi:chromosome segregation ATPase [Encephalitozoon intestinalis ATCC 50506]|uniref:Structural maintenance of chromosomes protein 5 n=1 Tax=Encephalitozoon intestinalis (strain ATCC 50506) TaxID=876142 RepID=E0SA67_ENCIT|nr:chromosome segregation ATPase [Encephalitozoon intestinalis ATCC 50506]ADM12689.1 chromosome segregation ATPase [Encephalitozoon intestinalis ATCC 50506]UTX46551.1 chromosome segregation ATPase [Encephalitozoon intestinalis]